MDRTCEALVERLPKGGLDPLSHRILGRSAVAVLEFPSPRAEPKSLAHSPHFLGVGSAAAPHLAAFTTSAAIRMRLSEERPSAADSTL